MAPELPIIVAGKLILIQPHRPPNGLAHLGPVGIGKERSGQPKNLRPIDPPSQLNAIDDIAPLVRTAHFKAKGCAPRPFQKVDRKSGVSGKSVSLLVDLGGRRIIIKKKK